MRSSNLVNANNNFDISFWKNDKRSDCFYITARIFILAFLLYAILCTTKSTKTVIPWILFWPFYSTKTAFQKYSVRISEWWRSCMKMCIAEFTAKIMTAPFLSNLVKIFMTGSPIKCQRSEAVVNLTVVIPSYLSISKLNYYVTWS